MSIENVFDVFMFCTAINLLNTYVKQQKKISYQFKKEIDVLISLLSINNFDGIKIDYQKDNNGTLLVINIYSKLSFDMIAEQYLLIKIT